MTRSIGYVQDEYFYFSGGGKKKKDYDAEFD